MNKNLLAVVLAVANGARTHRAICEATGIKSLATTRWWLVRAKAQGLVDFDLDKASTIRRGELLATWRDKGETKVGIVTVIQDLT